MKEVFEYGLLNFKEVRKVRLSQAIILDKFFCDSVNPIRIFVKLKMGDFEKRDLVFEGLKEDCSRSKILKAMAKFSKKNVALISGLALSKPMNLLKLRVTEIYVDALDGVL